MQILVYDLVPLLILFVLHFAIFRTMPWLAIFFALMDSSRIILAIPRAFDLR